MPVRVRFPSEAHESLLEEILRGIFVFMCTSLAQTRYIFAEEGSGAKVEDLNGTMRKKKTKEGLKYAVCESCGQHSQGYCKDEERVMLLILEHSFHRIMSYNSLTLAVLRFLEAKISNILPLKRQNRIKRHQFGL